MTPPETFAKNTDDAVRIATAVNANYSGLLHELHKSGVHWGPQLFQVGFQAIPTAIEHRFHSGGKRLGINIPPLAVPPSNTRELTSLVMLFCSDTHGITLDFDLNKREIILGQQRFNPLAFSRRNNIGQFDFCQEEVLHQHIENLVRERLEPEEMKKIATLAPSPTVSP